MTPEFTTEVVQEAMRGSGDPSLHFFAKIVGSFFGGPQDIACRRDFLRTVAFYNFIQDPLPSPKVRPSREMWTRAIPACAEVLQNLEPQFVLVLGRELWNHLSLPFRIGPSISLPDGKTSASQLYELPSRALSCFFPINHPSSVGWSYKAWCPWVKAAIQEAINTSRAV